MVFSLTSVIVKQQKTSLGLHESRRFFLQAGLGRVSKELPSDNSTLLASLTLLALSSEELVTYL